MTAEPDSTTRQTRSRKRFFVIGALAIAAIAALTTIVATVGPPSLFQGLTRTATPTVSKNDLWFASLDELGDLHIAVAIIDGKRWDGWPEQVGGSPTIPSDVDGISAEWLPPGRKFPTVWQAHLFNGNTLAFKATGMKRDVYGDLNIVTTNLTRAALSPTLRDFASEEGVSGLAVVGDIKATLFRPMTRDEQKRVLTTLEPRLSEAELKAIANLSAESGESREEAAEFKEALTRPEGLIVTHAVAVTQNDNVRFFSVELDKRYAVPERLPVYMTRFGATLSESASGNVQVLSLAAHIAGDKSASRFPIAVVERDGVQCWLAHDQLYEGFVLTLTSPGQLLGASDNCGLK
jgi:hypothetical protein